ncbi:hypothetical protein BH09ACT8_BH09ACT8_66220 [soil metagenome]
MISLAAWILTGCGVALILIGVFFLAMRPPLLAEDARFMGGTAETILGAMPVLGTWLRRVFWVLGGYVATTGMLVVYIASTGVRTGSVGALGVIAAAGVTSIGWMSVVNFIIRSDSRWVLLGLDSVWVFGLALAVASR